MIRRLITTPRRAWHGPVDTFSSHEKSFEKLTKSYVHCNSFKNIELSNLSISQLVSKSADLKPDGDAMVFCGDTSTRLSWQDMWETSVRLANSLEKLGVKKGDRLAVWAPSVPEWVIAQFACGQSGLILVTMNPVYTSDEAEYAFEKVDAKVVVSTKAYSEKLLAMKNYKPDIILQTGWNRVDVELEPPFTHLFQDLVKSGETTHSFGEIDADSVGMIQFTSGTTGRPKAASLTHRNLVNNAFGIGHRYGSILPEHRFCMNVPLFHCFGSVIGTMVAAASANTCVFPAEGYSPTAAIEAMREEKCTFIYGTPTMYIDIFGLAKRQGLIDSFETVKHGKMAGSICPPELNRQAIEEFGINLMVAYGTTENSPVVTGTFPDDSFEKKVNTIGFPLHHIECKIIDKNSHVVPIGKSGELCSRGYGVMKGYWGDEEKTKKVIDKNRWYHTGDLATMDEDGYLKIIGRLDDMFIRGGENVFPSEIEDVLLPHSKIEDAQVIGVEDYRLGNEIAVYIKLNDRSLVNDEKVVEELVKELKEYCSERLFKYKIPKYWKFVDSYPVTASGKIQKYKMRENSTQDFNLSRTQ